jgi:hypothetical protein
MNEKTVAPKESTLGRMGRNPNPRTPRPDFTPAPLKPTGTTRPDGNERSARKPLR